jgi:two-component system sensor histidine kinase/response regulator
VKDISQDTLSALPIIDVQHLAVLSELSDDSGNMVEELTQIFSSTTPPLLDQLKSALSSHDREAVRRLAHRLKGSAANVGAKRMAAHCSVLEQEAKMESADISKSCHATIEAQFRDSERALKTWLGHP